MKYDVYKGKELVGEAVLMKSDGTYLTQFWKTIHQTHNLKAEDFKAKGMRLKCPNDPRPESLIKSCFCPNCIPQGGIKVPGLA